MKENPVNEKALQYLEFINRENQFRHHRYDEEMVQYELLKAGDMRSVEECRRMFTTELTGHISEDPLRNFRYLFVASITLATRFAILGGMDEERAYNTSDLYILKMDECTTIEEIQELNADMFLFFTKEIAEQAKREAYSKPVSLCISYIHTHLHEPILAHDLAELVNLNPNYLSTRFKKEVGVTISAYIMSKKMEAASNMLKYSDYSYAEISSILNFSSQSHFTQAFKRHIGVTPKAYRERNHM